PKPDTRPTPLSVVYCPMVKAEWLQIGDNVANPYMGTEMSECGNVKRKLDIPGDPPELAAVVRSYLDVAKGLDADKLNADAVKKLKAAAEKLSGDKCAALRQAVGKLADAKDIKSARSAFKDTSAQLIKS